MDIVLSIDPVAIVPFWDVESDRIDLSLGPACCQRGLNTSVREDWLVGWECMTIDL
jgi:hypothetical protein